MPKWLRTALIRLAQQCAMVLSHFIVALLIAALGFGGHHLLIKFGDPKLFDVVPLRYVFDMMDSVLFIIVVALGIVEAVNVSRGES